MSRSWLAGEPDQWRMFCDICFEHDTQTFPTEPDLSLFRDAGWFIGRHTDACPKCFHLGESFSNPPHPVMAEVTA